MQNLGRTVEVVATLAIAIAIGGWGRLVLAGLERHKSISAVLLALAIVATVVAVRRDYRIPNEGARVAVTRDVAYLTALGLVLWAVVEPARWSTGSAIAMAEVAIVFDAFTRVVSRA